MDYLVKKTKGSEPPSTLQHETRKECKFVAVEVVSLARALRDQWNSTAQTTASWQPASTIAAIGDIVNSLPNYIRIVLDVFGGVLTLRLQFSGIFNLDSSSASVVLAFGIALQSIIFYLMAAFFVELISGRPLNE